MASSEIMARTRHQGSLVVSPFYPAPPPPPDGCHESCRQDSGGYSFSARRACEYGFAFESISRFLALTTKQSPGGLSATLHTEYP